MEQNYRTRVQKAIYEADRNSNRESLTDIIVELLERINNLEARLVDLEITHTYYGSRAE